MKDVYLICNAHIDPIWQWNRQEGISAAISTFRSAANLAEKHDYVFCHGEALLYRCVEEYDPCLFERIKELVRLGKWRIMGGWYLQPDCNMPSGESFVRQIQVGKTYFKEKFGATPTTAINFDSFGHSKGLVQIIRRCGQDSYIHTRPAANQMSYPSYQYLWEGFDGSRIKAFRTTGTYGTPLGRSLEAIDRRAERQGDELPCVLWGVGNHGGGPSHKDLCDIEEAQGKKFNYIHSYPEEFFSKIEPTAVVDASLRTSMPGCYSAMSRVKRGHIELENRLYVSEIMATVAENKGLMKYPQNELLSAQLDLLLSEFHDVLPGTCIKSAEDEALAVLHHGVTECNKADAAAFFALTSELDSAKEGEYPIAVFNPHPYKLCVPVECEFILSDQNLRTDVRSEFTLVDSHGKPVDFQVIKEESNINLDWRKRIVFEAELEGLSMNRYSLFVEFKEAGVEKKEKPLVYDNGSMRVEIDENTGLLKSFSSCGIEYIRDGFLPVVFCDNADPWAMSEAQLQRVGTDKSDMLLSDKPCGVFRGMESINVIENGDVYLGIECFFEHENTRARVEYKIYKKHDYVDVNVDLFMGDVDSIVKLELPIAATGKLLGQTAYGTEALFDDAREFVYQRFIAVDSGDSCLAVLNNSTYGGHYEDGKLYISLCRGTTYCAHPILDRELIPADRYTKKMDQGEHNYSFRICACKRDELERKAAEFARKPIALQAFPCQKREAKPYSVEISDSNVVMTAMKKCESRDGYILRLFNNSDESKIVTLGYNGIDISLNFTKYEFKTVLADGDRLTELDEAII